MQRSRPKLLTLFAPTALAMASIGLSFIGFATPQDLSTPDYLSDLVYRVIRNVGPGSDYDHAGAGGNAWLQAARWTGLAFALWAALSIIYNGFRATRAWLMVRLRHNHIVIVGDTDFARNVAHRCAGHVEVVHVTEEGEPDVRGEYICLPGSYSETSLFSAANTGQARAVLVSTADDGRNISLAVAAARQYPRLSVTVRFNNSALVPNFHDLPGAETVRAFSDTYAAAKEIVRRHPPFLLAEDLRQSRIHLVIVGDGTRIEALVVEAILSACTLTFGKLAFTLVTPQPEAFRAGLIARYPEIELAADITCLDLGDGHSPSGGLPDAGTITALYCAFDDAARSLSTALAWREQQLKHKAFGAAVFVRLEGEHAVRPLPGARLATGALVSFGGAEDVARASGLAQASAGRSAERLWHETYQAKAGKERAAAVAWEVLPEPYRISNARSVAHIPAKLFEAGFDLRGWLATHDPFAELPALALGKGERLWRSQTERTRLAELEHARWIADRRMSGWSGGAVRDETRKIHDNFVPFEALSDEVKGYDYIFVDLLDQVLKRSPKGMRRLP